MRKLLLKCGLSPGDLVMLTAAVRDLHHWNPGQFQTDVRTCCPELWENNPYLTPLSEDDPEVRQIDCGYPLINQCNETPYHCLHGFIQFLNEQLQLTLKPTAFKGDIHLSEQEKAWFSQVYELTGEPTPFWIVAAGGKYDVTIKWWESARYQEVVDQLRGKVQFVQVGDLGHHHPKLAGTIDLRGKTNLRELIRLVYHAQGVLCSVTALMHLAAAVETRPGSPPNRPCVVIAGAREPAHWEAYPGHQYIHTNGAVRCGGLGGCWKDRVTRLRDGDDRDRAGHLCLDVVKGLPKCMHMITAAEVVRRMEYYFQGGVIQRLSPAEAVAAERGVVATRKNCYDEQPLNLHSAGIACEKFIENLPGFSEDCQGRGIVICGGGIRYFTNAWVCIQMLRRLGCVLPVELWHLGPAEMDDTMKSLLVPLGVECVDARKKSRRFPTRRLAGWELKPYAIIHSKFREILFLDADNVAVVNPEFLFETRQFKSTGAVFWPDYDRGRDEKAAPIWRSCGLRQPGEEFETGQMVLDKRRCWRALRLTLWFNEHSDFYYQYLHGDKETFHLAFRKLKQSYCLVPQAIHKLDGTMCQHDFGGIRIFQHRNSDKWDIFPHNRQVEDFWFEAECREYLRQLRGRWDARIHSGQKFPTAILTRRWQATQPPRMTAVVISTPERSGLRRQTLDSLAATDWGEIPLEVELGEIGEKTFRKRQGIYLGLKKGLRSDTGHILILADDLVFNLQLRHNLSQWQPLTQGNAGFASLYNFGVSELACDFKRNARLVAPKAVGDSQAWLISREMAALLVRRWNRMAGSLGRRIALLAARSNQMVFYHAPSLVQLGEVSQAAGTIHPAIDFIPSWRAGNDNRLPG